MRTKRPTNRTQPADALPEAMKARRGRLIGRLLVRSAATFQERAVGRIRAAGHRDYRLADNAVLIHLGPEGASMAELARRARMTRQGMRKAVRQLETRGIVQTAPDPEDGRAQRVTFTAKGEERLRVGVAVVEELDAEIAELVGPEQVEVVRDALIHLLEAWDPDGY